MFRGGRRAASLAPAVEEYFAPDERDRTARGRPLAALTATENTRLPVASVSGCLRRPQGVARRVLHLPAPRVLDLAHERIGQRHVVEILRHLLAAAERP